MPTTKTKKINKLTIEGKIALSFGYFPMRVYLKDSNPDSAMKEIERIMKVKYVPCEISYHLPSKRK